MLEDIIAQSLGKKNTKRNIIPRNNKISDLTSKKEDIPETNSTSSSPLKDNSSEIDHSTNKNIPETNSSSSPQPEIKSPEIDQPKKIKTTKRGFNSFRTQRDATEEELNKAYGSPTNGYYWKWLDSKGGWYKIKKPFENEEERKNFRETILKNGTAPKPKYKNTMKNVLKQITQLEVSFDRGKSLEEIRTNVREIINYITPGRFDLGESLGGKTNEEVCPEDESSEIEES